MFLVLRFKQTKNDARFLSQKKYFYSYVLARRKCSKDSILENKTRITANSVFYNE